MEKTDNTWYYLLASVFSVFASIFFIYELFWGIPQKEWRFEEKLVVSIVFVFLALFSILIAIGTIESYLKSKDE